MTADTTTPTSRVILIANGAMIPSSADTRFGVVDEARVEASRTSLSAGIFTCIKHVRPRMQRRVMLVPSSSHSAKSGCLPSRMDPGAHPAVNASPASGLCPSAMVAATPPSTWKRPSYLA